jgi:hypothetical protein
MDAEMAKDARRIAHGGGTPRDGVAESSCRQAPVDVAIFGEPIVGRALALLLRGARYDTRFVSASSPGEATLLEGVHLLLLVPTPNLSAEHREALLAGLGEATAVADIPMLELVAFPERTGQRHAQVRWPCSAEQLERCIETALLARACQKDRWDSLPACGAGEWRSA